MAHLMTQPVTEPRPFQPGTTGWSASDLDDPRIERLWENGRYEIVDGVLTTMPPAYFIGGNAAFNVAFAVKLYLMQRNLPGRFAPEVDIVIDEPRVVRPIRFCCFRMMRRNNWQRRNWQRRLPTPVERAY
ncbi:MAG TPA: hypothetical protein VFE47_27055 [Tepidisphaeraceae bacterium]|jgi:Uma2 family endonuclease|nr:hypothetical protein [Tepidisphaeraceae bacterium]